MYKIADSHNDFIIKLSPERVRSFLLGEVKDCRVELLTAAVCSSDRPTDFFTAENLITLFAPVRDAQTRVLIEYEGLCYLNKNNLDILEKAPPFSVTLTWNADNAIAGGCRGGTNKGITPFGHDILKILREHKIAIDTAHLNRKSFFELIDAAESGTVYNSHTCIADIFSDGLIMERNITKEQAKLIVERNGFIGITLIPYFLRGHETQATAEDVFRHIDFIVQNFGAKNVGIGSDFYGAINYPQGISDYYGYHSIIKTMEKHNYSVQTIQKILFSNYQNFCNRCATE